MSDTQQPDGQARLALEGDLTIYQAAAHKAALMAALESCGRLELDVSGAAEIDTAGLQLLVLAKREAAARGKTVSITGHGPAVREAIDVCNLAVTFGDPMIVPSQAPRGAAHG